MKLLKWSINQYVDSSDLIGYDIFTDKEFEGFKRCIETNTLPRVYLEVGPLIEIEVSSYALQDIVNTVEEISNSEADIIMAHTKGYSSGLVNVPRCFIELYEKQINNMLLSKTL